MRRAPRQQVIWYRQQAQVVTLTTAAPLAIAPIALFAVSVLDEPGLDERLTLLRLRLNVGTCRSSADANNGIGILAGIYRSQLTAAVRDPQMLTATDAQTDFLSEKLFTLAQNAAGNSALGVQQTSTEWDVKAKRKLDADDIIVLAGKLVSFLNPGVLPVGVTAHVWVQANALFQRTMR